MSNSFHGIHNTILMEKGVFSDITISNTQLPSAEKTFLSNLIFYFMIPSSTPFIAGSEVYFLEAVIKLFTPLILGNVIGLLPS